MRNGTVFVSGTFNVLHPGHLRLLKFAKDSGERLIVGVLSDRVAGVSAHVPQEFRLEAVKMHAIVDEAFLIDDSVNDAIRKIKPARVVKGKEHKTKDNPEQEAVDSYGGKLLFSSGDVVFTSLDLIRREMAIQEPKTITLPTDFMARRGVTKKSLSLLLSKMKDMQVVVIGDTIVDEYISCDPLGMSEEDPTILLPRFRARNLLAGRRLLLPMPRLLAPK